MAENLTERWRQFRQEVQGARDDMEAFAKAQFAATSGAPGGGQGARTLSARSGAGGGGGGGFKSAPSTQVTADGQAIVAAIREEGAKTRQQARSDGGTALRAQGLG